MRLSPTCIVALLLLAACGAPSDDDAGTGADSALTDATGAWDAAAESEFSRWIAALGTARESGRCTTLNACVNDGSINTLHRDSDAQLDIFADCADVPMELRAYFAVKTGRVFSYVSKIEGTGPDERYSAGNHPTAWSTAGQSRTMQTLLKRVSDVVDTGFYRMAPEVVDDDTYPIDPSPTSLRPGSVFYDPNGHVLLVYRVGADGTVFMMDGHPDNSLTYGPLTEGKYAVGGRSQGGGFRNFRPEHWDGTHVVYAKNEELHDFGDTQYGHGDQYVAWVRQKLGGTAAAPDQQVSAALDQICIDLQDRVRAVAAGATLAAGPLGDLPPNIYAAAGDWESFSTPGRDARLRASFRSVFKVAKSAIAADASMKAKLASVWSAHVAKSGCNVTYVNGAGANVTLTLADVMTRIYDLSFDPYHGTELRWGAHPRAPAEAATCASCDDAHMARFDAERRNRNVIDRTPVDVTGPDYGPDVPEDIDVGALLRGP